MKRSLYWYPIDNAGKIFPAVSKHNRSSVFRLSFYIKDIVDPIILEKAVNEVLPRIEPFAVQLKSGLFWYYLSVNHKPFRVKEEPPIVCKFEPWSTNNGYLFQVYYYKNKITLETFHSLSDGTGAMEFLKSIVFRYLQLQGHSLEHEGLILSQAPFTQNEVLDSFLYSYDKNNKKKLKEEPAYHMKGETFKDDFSLCIRVKVPTKQLLDYTRKLQVTIGEYVTALLAYSIYMRDLGCRTSKKPIKIFVPVNLRKFFPSTTLRNFSLYIKATYHGTKPWDFPSLLESTKEQFKAQLQKDDLHGRINSNVSIEKNLLVRMLPLFIKNIAFRCGYYYLAENINTCAISNLGNITLPTDMKPLIKDVEFSIGGTSMAIASIHDHTNIMLNSMGKDLSVFQYFIQALSEAGMDVVIDTNYKEGLDEIL